MGFSVSTIITGLLFMICYGGLLPGSNLPLAHSQLLPQQNLGSNRDTLPLHLAGLAPHQTGGYIILPKSSFVLPKSNGPPLPPNRKPERRPPNVGPINNNHNKPPPNRQRRPPPPPPKKNNQNFPSNQLPPRNNFNPQFLDSTLPQNIKLEQTGQNRPPILPNFQLKNLKMKNRPKNVPVLIPESSEPPKLKESLELSKILDAPPHRENEVDQEGADIKAPQFLEPKGYADPLKPSEQENKPFHIPFPDFAEPEPGPQMQGSNFPPNRIPPPQERAKNNEVLVPEESISLYGQVLPPNDATYSSEINNFPGIDDEEEGRWPAVAPEMPKITHLDVKCEKNLMRVSIDFDKPFHGIVYSKGHFSYGRCVHLPAGSGHSSVQFDISINSCGMQGSSPTGHYGPTETGSYFENTVVVQYDPLVQEVWDQARKLRCNWHDQYEKTVTFRPFSVDMLQVVRADFAGDNVGCWMQIQVGKGPWASEVAGIVRIGQTMTLVLAIKDEENKFDMMVRNCIAHDGNRAPIELVDSSGCVTRPKLMSRFTKVKNFGSSASVLSFAHFQAFKFPDSTEVHVQCTVQICRQQCEDQCSLQRRRRRQAEDEDRVIRVEHRVVKREEVKEVGLNSVLQVVAAEDLSFSPYENATDAEKIITEKSRVCMSSSGFAASLILLLAIVVISCLIAAFLFLKQRNAAKMPPLPYDMAVFKKHMEKQAVRRLQQHTLPSRQPQKKI